MLRPRPPRSGLVARAALVERLGRSTESRVVLVVAGAGFGKTALLELWAAADDLAMNRGEADALLRAAAVGLGTDELDVLLHRTEGWPAGLSLAALALVEQPDRARAVASFAGDDRLVAGYLRDEVLGQLSP